MVDTHLLAEHENTERSYNTTRSVSLLSLNEKWFFHDLSPEVSNRILSNTLLHTCFLVTNSLDIPTHFFIYVKYNNDDLRRFEVIQNAPAHFQISKSSGQTYSSLFEAVYAARDIHFKDVPPIFDRAELTMETMEISSILTPPSYDEVLNFQAALKDLPPISSENVARPTEATDEDLTGGRHRFHDMDEPNLNCFERLIQQRRFPVRRSWDLRNSGALRVVAMLVFYFSTLCILPHLLALFLIVVCCGLVCLPLIILFIFCYRSAFVYIFGEDDD